MMKMNRIGKSYRMRKFIRNIQWMRESLMILFFWKKDNKGTVVVVSMVISGLVRYSPKIRIVRTRTAILITIKMILRTHHHHPHHHIILSEFSHPGIIEMRMRTILLTTIIVIMPPIYYWSIIQENQYDFLRCPIKVINIYQRHFDIISKSVMKYFQTNGKIYCNRSIYRTLVVAVALIVVAVAVAVAEQERWLHEMAITLYWDRKCQQ
mmetsp:Transcript_10663/g.10311  ORF Transcript_10663/g.10311 Transcript_10663/m.10311 type:complete len:209 (-) Transcript_10663:199-825(-)